MAVPNRVSSRLQLGKMFFEDSYGGVERLGGFDEHIGCTECDAFTAVETRRGPWVAAPVARTVKQITFTRPNCSCQLFDITVKPGATSADSPSAAIRTGPPTDAEESAATVFEEWALVPNGNCTVKPGLQLCQQVIMA
jgi:hypothetical protein